MTSKELVVPRVLATGTASIATVTTTNVNFGSPNDTWVQVGTNYRPGDRIVVVITGSTGGTTDTTSYSIQDAPDNAGSIGTPATAVTLSPPSGDTLAGGTGNRYVVVGVQLQPGRPWLRVRATRASGTTDTVVVRAVILAVPHNL